MEKKRPLKQTERDILLQFGKTLGKHDLEHQQKQIRLALSHLERVEKEGGGKPEGLRKDVPQLGVVDGTFNNLAPDLILNPKGRVVHYHRRCIVTRG